jgi:hypothetical protein
MIEEGVEWTKVKHTHRGYTLRPLLNINLNINNKTQDCIIGTVGGGSSGRVEGKGRVKEWYMFDGLHTPIRNKTKKPLAIALSGVRRGLMRRDDGTM